ncbi:MAG: HAD family phosphatase [Hespellia sp.]|nr:HAD family phosphatase [Hespellia sp.]
MKYKGAIFDMDGVLFDTERVYQETWHEIAAERNVELGADYLKAISGSYGEHMRHVVEAHYHVQDGTEIVTECMQRVRNKLAAQVPVKPGVYEILELFREKGLKMAVASSSLKPQIEANLQNAKMDDYFDEVVSSSQVEHGKPAPDIFLYAAQKIGCRPEDCLVFEDSENGVRAGNAAGCIVIMIPDLIEPSPEIRPYCAAICPDFFQVEM